MATLAYNAQSLNQLLKPPFTLKPLNERYGDFATVGRILFNIYHLLLKARSLSAMVTLPKWMQA